MSVLCSVLGCDRLAKQRGWCSKHYQRWYVHGDPKGGRTERGALPRFLDAAIAWVSDDHLLWPFGGRGHYPNITLDGRLQQVNRVICERVNGPPPSDRHEAAHSCGIKLCCNPQHIYWATPKENSQDTIKHGTREKMNRRGMKLSEESKKLVSLATKRRWQDPLFVEKMSRRKPARGEQHGRAKLSKEDVEEIRKLRDQFTQMELAIKFGVYPSTISMILSGKSWS